MFSQEQAFSDFVDEDNYAEVYEEGLQPVYESIAEPFYESVTPVIRKKDLKLEKKCSKDPEIKDKTEKKRLIKEEKKKKRHEDRKKVISCPLPESFVHISRALLSSNGLVIEGMDIDVFQDLVKQSGISKDSVCHFTIIFIKFTKGLTFEYSRTKRISTTIVRKAVWIVPYQKETSLNFLWKILVEECQQLYRERKVNLLV